MANAKEAFADLYALLNRYDRIGLAVSGGTDSSALMFLVAQWAKVAGKLSNITVLSVDHGLRENSGPEADDVCRRASELGLDVVVFRWQHDGIESAIQQRAREARYGLMTDWCAKHDVPVLVTAHILDDQAETFLMRLARGSGVDGLCAMAKISERNGILLARPLLGVTRAELVAVLKENQQSWIDDPTNNNRDFERVRVRAAMPKFAEIGVDGPALALSAKRLGRASRALETMCDDAMKSCVEVFDTGHSMIDRKQFNKLEEEIALRVLGRLIVWAAGRTEQVQMVKLERLLDELGGNEREKHTLGGVQVFRRKASLVIGREFGRIGGEPVLKTTRWDGRFIFDRVVDVQAYGAFIDEDERQRPTELPYFVACALPVIVLDDGKLCVPHLDLDAEIAVKLSRLPKGVTNHANLSG